MRRMRVASTLFYLSRCTAVIIIIVIARFWRGAEARARLSIPNFERRVTFPPVNFDARSITPRDSSAFSGACITSKAEPCPEASSAITCNACLRPPGVEIIFGGDPPLNVTRENNNISVGPWPTSMPRFIGLDWRWISCCCERSINSLRRIRFVIINRLNEIRASKNARGI